MFSFQIIFLCKQLYQLNSFTLFSSKLCFIFRFIPFSVPRFIKPIEQWILHEYHFHLEYNYIGLLNWYWWILARVGIKNARTCECILKPTSANIHQNQFTNSYIIKLKHFSVNLHGWSDKFISIFYAEWWYYTASSVKACNISNHTTQQFNMLSVRWDIFVEKYEKLWLSL